MKPALFRSLFLAAALSFLLAGCGGSSSGTPLETAPAQETAAAAPAAESVPTEEPAQTHRPVIQAVMPKTPETPDAPPPYEPLPDQPGGEIGPASIPSSAPATSNEIVNVPDAGAVLTDGPAAGALVSDVVFNHEISEGEPLERGVITAVSAEGETVWSYVSSWYPLAQLSCVAEIGVFRDGYFFESGGTIRKLDIYTGKQIWSNSEFGGAVTGSDFGPDGRLYLCGYFGPDLFVCDAAGRTVLRTESLDEEFFWPMHLRFDGRRVEILYESAAAGALEVGQLLFDPESGSVVSRAVYPLAGREQISAVSCSSSLTEDGAGYPADNVLDGDSATAWVEGAAGQGIGESLSLRFREPCLVYGMTIYAGYQKDERIYGRNSRPSVLLLRFSDGSSEMVALEDFNGPQTISLRDPVITESVTIELCDVYPGSAYEDTAISELELYG